MAFSPDEIDRYDRQMRLPEWGAAGQERLRAATVAVIGEGPAARAAATYLEGAGVGRLQVAAGAEPLRALNPHVSIETSIPERLRLHARDRPVALVVNGAGVIAAADDREAEGAACAVEALKAILGLPHLVEVALPRLAAREGDGPPR